MMTPQFRDERCAACGCEQYHHELHFPGFFRFLWLKLTGAYRGYPHHCTGRCSKCPPRRRCQRFVGQPDALPDPSPERDQP